MWNDLQCLLQYLIKLWASEADLEVRAAVRKTLWAHILIENFVNVWDNWSDQLLLVRDIYIYRERDRESKKRPHTAMEGEPVNHRTISFHENTKTIISLWLFLTCYASAPDIAKAWLTTKLITNTSYKLTSHLLSHPAQFSPLNFWLYLYIHDICTASHQSWTTINQSISIHHEQILLLITSNHRCISSIRVNLTVNFNHELQLHIDLINLKQQQIGSFSSDQIKSHQNTSKL